MALSPRVVRELRPVGGGGFVLGFDYAQDFLPGQVVAAALDPHEPSRYYSLASAPGGEQAQILFTVVEDGLLTPRLVTLTAGDTILVSAPFGQFHDGSDGPSSMGEAVWIANGTGVAPFLSMVRSGLRKGRLLIQGSRTREGLFFEHELRSALGSAYVPCCTQERGAGLHAGRLTEKVKTMIFSPASRFFLCGSASMIVDVRDILISQGVPFGSILSEIYF